MPVNPNQVNASPNYVPVQGGTHNYVPVPAGSPNYVQGTINYNPGSGNYGLGIHRPVLNPFFHQESFNLDKKWLSHSERKKNCLEFEEFITKKILK